MVGKFLAAWFDSRPDVRAALLEADGTVRLAPLLADQRWDGRTPYVVYTAIDGDSLRDLAGPTGDGSRLVQLSIVGATYAQADGLARLVRGTKDDLRLNGYRGTLGGVYVKAAWLESERDVTWAPAHAEGRGVAEVQQDYRIYFEEVEAT